MFLHAFLGLQFLLFSFLIQNGYGYHWKAKWLNFVYLQKLIWIIVQEGWYMPNLRNQRVLNFRFQFQKFSRLYHNAYIPLFCKNVFTKAYQGLLYNGTHLPHFKICPWKLILTFSYLQEVIISKLIIWKMKWDVECEFIFFWTIWHHPHWNAGISFGIGVQNAIQKFDLRFDLVT